MASDQTTQAVCNKCRSAMIYVTAMPHPTARQMRRTTFVCYTCRQTRNYMLSALMADAYAAASSHDGKASLMAEAYASSRDMKSNPENTPGP